MQEVNLLPLRLAFSSGDDRFCGNRMMTHQTETMHSECRLITVDAPTASGKTVAFLSRIVKSKKDAAVVLPTNELLEDQARSICQSLRQQGFNVFDCEHVGREEYLSTEDRSPPSFAIPRSLEPDYAVLIVSGDRLFELARHGSKGVALTKLFAIPANHLILITNPDTIQLIFRAKYAKSGTILRELLRFNILVVDEFHMYHGTTLANLFFLLWNLRNVFHQLIITTATPSPAIVRLGEFLNPSLAISAQPTDKDGHMVRHPMRLRVIPHPQDHFLRDNNDLDVVIGHIMQLYKKNRLVPSTVKTLVIVNSIAFCIKLARRLKEELGEENVSEVHSLVPNRERHYAELTIGTSAIEIGIDFDTASILFEAGDAPAFIQRVGRAARHREAEGIAIVPPETALYFKEHAPTDLPYSELRRLVYAAMDEPRSYHEFLSSPECAELYAGFLYGMAHIVQNEYPDRNALVSSVNETSHQPPFLDIAHLKEYLGAFFRKEITTIAEAGFRGYLRSIPVCLENYNNRMTRLGFFELPMLKPKRVVSAEEFNEGYGMADGKERVLVVEEFVEQPYIFRMTWPNDCFKRIMHISEDTARLDISNPGLNSIFFKLLEGLPAYATCRRPDWRLPTIKHSSRQEWLVIGLDAYLQAFLDRTAGVCL